jgi:hypothetical protein
MEHIHIRAQGHNSQHQFKKATFAGVMHLFCIGTQIVHSLLGNRVIIRNAPSFISLFLQPLQQAFAALHHERRSLLCREQSELRQAAHTQEVKVYFVKVMTRMATLIHESSIRMQHIGTKY